MIDPGDINDDDAAALAHQAEIDWQLLTEQRWTDNTDDDDADNEEYFNAISESSP